MSEVSEQAAEVLNALQISRSELGLSDAFLDEHKRKKARDFYKAVSAAAVVAKLFAIDDPKDRAKRVSEYLEALQNQTDENLPVCDGGPVELITDRIKTVIPS